MLSSTRAILVLFIHAFRREFCSKKLNSSVRPRIIIFNKFFTLHQSDFSEKTSFVKCQLHTRLVYQQHISRGIVPRFKGTRHMIQLNNISGQVHDGLCSTTCMLAWLTISCTLFCCDLSFNSCNFSIFKAKCPAFCSWEKKNGFERLNSMRKEFEFILVFLSIFFFVMHRALPLLSWYAFR